MSNGDSSADSPRRKPSPVWKWMRRVIIGLFTLLVIVVIALCVCAAYVNNQADKEMASALAELTRRALPVSREWMFSTCPAAGRPSARFLEAAFALRKPTDTKRYSDLPIIGPEGTNPKFREPISPELAGKLRDFVAEQKQYFDLLEEARRRDERLDLMEPLRPLHVGRPLTGARRATKDWLVASLAAQADGDAKRAAQCCSRALWVGTVFDGQPLLIATLVRVSIGALVASRLEDALSRCRIEQGQLRDLQRSLAGHDAAIDLREAVKGEIAFLVETAGDPDLYLAIATDQTAVAVRTMEKAHRKVEALRDRLPGVAWADLDELRLPVASRGRLRRALAARWVWHWLCPRAVKLELARAINQHVSELDKLKQSLPELAARANAAEADNGNHGELLSPRGIQLVLQGKAGLRVAVAALAVEVHSIEHGTWPRDLAAADKDPPTDPFTGEAVKFKRTPGGVVIYSVGENLLDDGGKNRSAGGDDITFRLLDPATRNKPGKTPTPASRRK